MKFLHGLIYREAGSLFNLGRPNSSGSERFEIELVSGLSLVALRGGSLASPFRGGVEGAMYPADRGDCNRGQDLIR